MLLSKPDAAGRKRGRHEQSSSEQLQVVGRPFGWRIEVEEEEENGWDEVEDERSKEGSLRAAEQQQQDEDQEERDGCIDSKLSARNETLLLPWDSDGGLLMDRFDVRLLLGSIPVACRAKTGESSRKRQKGQSEASRWDGDEGDEADEIEEERYRDLHQVAVEEEMVPCGSSLVVEQAGTAAVMVAQQAGYSRMPFSYSAAAARRSSSSSSSAAVAAAAAEAREGMKRRGGSGANHKKMGTFNLPFEVPPHLNQHLPRSEKHLLLMVRTAEFVSRQGGQAEVLLRVKQGGQPLLSFLLPADPLHALFRYLVSNVEQVVSSMAQREGQQQQQQEKKKKERQQVVAAEECERQRDGAHGKEEEEAKGDVNKGGKEGSMALLGGMYSSAIGSSDGGGGEGMVKEEEFEAQRNEQSEESGREEGKGVTLTAVHGTEKVWSRGEQMGMGQVDETAEKQWRDKLAVFDNAASFADGSGDGDASAHAAAASAAAASDDGDGDHSTCPAKAAMRGGAVSEQELAIMNKLAEFIVRNGADFERIIRERDESEGRFPFLLAGHCHHAAFQDCLQQQREREMPTAELVTATEPKAAVSDGGEEQMGYGAKEHAESGGRH